MKCHEVEYEIFGNDMPTVIGGIGRMLDED